MTSRYADQPPTFSHEGIEVVAWLRRARVKDSAFVTHRPMWGMKTPGHEAVYRITTALTDDIAAVLTVYDEHVAPEARGLWRDRLAALIASGNIVGEREP